MNNNTREKLGAAFSGGKLILILAIIGVCILFSILNPNYFSMINFVNILLAASLTGLVAIGEAYLIIGALCDLTPGSLVAFCGVLGATLAAMGIPFAAVMIITLAVGAAVGWFNAFLVNEVRLEAFIATLVSQTLFRGFAYIICNGKPVPITDAAYITLGQARLLGIPVSVWLMVVLMAVAGFVLARTKFGRSVYAIGGNKAAARLAGLNPKRINYVMFMMLGLLCALGGIVFSSRMHSGQPAANVNLEFDAITAVVLGGVAFSGGVGDMAGVALGVILLQAFNTGLTMVNVPAFWQYVARGGLLLIALTSDFMRKRNRERALLEASKKAVHA